eukprot:TRINITY_DN4040_c0_g1_i1.p1 TRINITY_DN4040_c0_g1~~TRINITY_DN4040_c0_g1_i1.p1  ORF type:complete len:324 (-),score=79.22 TRINITY_DN4040_c0_g1_i1:143-1054(-)
MVKIFITGGTGYIGFEVALALRRAGHVVYALARSAKSPYAKTLAENEVRVIEGDIQNTASFLDVAKDASVLIHAAADYTAFDKIDSLAIDAFFEAVNQQSKIRKLIIYTGGILVYPDSRSVSTEETPTDDSIAFLSGRRSLEQRVLTASNADGVVIRPAYVYGKRNVGVFYNYFEQATKKEEVFITTNPSVGWSHIHVDDLAEAYVRIVDAPRANVSGQIFNVTDDSRTTNEEIAREFAGLAGYKGPIASKPEKGWPVANRSVYASSRKLTRITGWYPKHIGILSEAEVYYNHWKSFATTTSQ